ncbi:dienelactone hydrolase family protein [Patescibacteria group bacterium]|nr:dienelactone hydrolase family protein [Patescibacteria group bacterium]
MNHSEIDIEIEKITLPGLLTISKQSTSLVIFTHGSGSSRFSKRNNYVAEVLNRAGIATLLFDLLTEKEDEIYETRFDIQLITDRLVQTTQWILGNQDTQNLDLGYFGASTGAAAALNAAAILPEHIKAVVSRGGRPDLSLDFLSQVQSPTLLLVGSLDDIVIELNQQAFVQLTCPKELTIIDGATHLFEEPGKLEEVSKLAVKWFTKYL